MVLGIDGSIRNGKTLFMSRLAWNYILIHGPNARIFTNYDLDFPFFLGFKIQPQIYSTAEELIDIITNKTDCLILLDEASKVVSSKDWAKIPRGVLEGIQQSGKQKADIIYTAQSIHNVCNVLRQNTSFVYRTKIFYFGKWIEDDLLDPKTLNYPLKEYKAPTPILLKIGKYKGEVSETDSEKKWIENRVFIRFFFPWQFKHWYKFYNTFQRINFRSFDKNKPVELDIQSEKPLKINGWNLPIA